MLTLGIETSCDETAAAVIENKNVILSNVVVSSVHLHKKFGGIIPELASRYHVEHINKVVTQALVISRKRLNDIGLISVTYGPGLIGALLVGVCFAKSISLAKDIPLIGVNHLQAHLYAAVMSLEKDWFPCIGLVVSGGHTALCLIEDVDKFTLLGQTKDDAVGEAFDKVAKILNIGYPGGAVIEKKARRGNHNDIRFSAFSNRQSLDFSFSGIKTAVLYYVNDLKKKNEARFQHMAIKAMHPGIDSDIINNICVGFQSAVVKVLVDRVIAACKKKRLRRLVLGGGVSINNYLRGELVKRAKEEKILVRFCDRSLCLDNAAMIAGLGYRLFKKGKTSTLALTPISSLSIET
ncbi:MAG: tRNA (adenosine(37)-N6)-threonylcarbamoyltransferase complex transferase subunit TsaD [Candidatus Omnitrophota bacterium]